MIQNKSIEWTRRKFVFSSLGKSIKRQQLEKLLLPPPALLLKAYTKLGGGVVADKDHPACERPVTLLRALGDVVVSRLRIAGLGFGDWE